MHAHRKEIQISNQDDCWHSWQDITGEDVNGTEFSSSGARVVRDVILRVLDNLFVFREITGTWVRRNAIKEGLNGKECCRVRR